MSTDDLSAPPSPCADLDPLVKFLLARLDDDETAARGHMRSGGILPFESIGRAAATSSPCTRPTSSVAAASSAA